MHEIAEPQTDQLLWDSLEKEEEEILRWHDGIDKSKLTSYQRSLLDFYENGEVICPSIEEGQIIEGKIEQISRKEVVINVNYKDFIYVENNSTDWKFVRNLKVGNNIKVLVHKIMYKPQFKIVGSISELMRLDVENKIKDIYTDMVPIDATVVSRNSAGFVLVLEINGIEIDAFMPNTIAAPNKLTSEQSDNLVGTKIKVCLETLKEDKKGLYVVSRKKYLQEHLFPEEIKKLKTDGTIYNGHITGTTPYGVFVEFHGCLTGMIHKYNLNPDYDIKDLRAGMGIQFYVKDIVKKGTEIILTQIDRPSLWDSIKVGKIIEGIVINNKHFGSLIKLDEETFGVIQTTYLKRANRKLTVGEKVYVKVISYLKDDRKIYLNFVE